MSHSYENSYEHMVFSCALVTHNCYHENQRVNVNLSMVWISSGMPGLGMFLSSLRKQQDGKIIPGV